MYEIYALQIKFKIYSSRLKTNDSFFLKLNFTFKNAFNLNTKIIFELLRINFEMSLKYIKCAVEMLIL